MRGRPSLNGLIVGAAAVTALFLTVTRPSPESLIGFGMGDREVRAAPGASASSVRSKHNLTALKVFNRTLIRIRDSYVDPGRIEPKEMLFAALDSVQFNIPEVLVDPAPATDEVTVTVNDKTQTFSTKDVTSPWKLSGKLKKIFQFIERNMNPGADLARVEYAAVNGMLSTLDPHSVLLNPDMAKEMDVNTKGDFGGLGIVIGMRKRKLTVIRPMKNTPAWAAGIKAKDHIVKISDEVTENLTLQEAVNRMRGKAGSSVVLWIERKNETGLIRFEITRDVIRVPSVESKLLSKNVGYIKLKQFAGRTANETKRAMDDLRSQGARAWVLDLRWNPGGLLEQAIQVGDLFLDKGTIVTTVGGREREPRRATRRGTDANAPVVVLVNASSASASEIVAGALKNLDRALLIGSTTFGKGSVQILYDNADGSKLKLTIAQYLTPGDLSIQSTGIVPDIELFRMYVPKKNDSPSDQFRLVPSSHSYREKDLKAHLDSRWAAKKPDKPSVTLRYLYQSKKKADADNEDDREDLDEEPTDDEIIVDYEIELARDLVSSFGNPTRGKMIIATKRAIRKRSAVEVKKLADALAVLGVDWTAPAKRGVSKASLTATFEIEGHSSVVKAGERIKLVGTITNNGSGTAYRVHARAKSQDRLFDDTELVFGKLDAGETRSWTAHIKVPENALDRYDVIEFEIRESQNASSSVSPLSIRIVAAERPVFAYSHQLIDGGNGDGLVQPLERHTMRITVKNTGKGTAKETTAILRNASGSDVVMERARFEIGELKPGESRDVEFAFKVGPSVKFDEVVVELKVYDSVLRTSVVEKLKFPVHKPSAGPAAASGAIRVVQDNTAVYEGAADRSAWIATAKRGTVFKVTGKQGDWYRVMLANKRPGFVKVSNVKRTNSKPKLGSLELRWQVTPPKLTVNIPSYQLRGKRYTLRGTATDDTKIEDVYIFVSNREAKIDNRKVFYKSNRGSKTKKSLSFASEIPLWPGSNLVTVVARENGEVRSSHTMYLYRTDGVKTAKAASKKR